MPGMDGFELRKWLRRHAPQPRAFASVSDPLGVAIITTAGDIVSWHECWWTHNPVAAFTSKIRGFRPLTLNSRPFSIYTEP